MIVTARSFSDTNILVYADDNSAGPKQRRALELVAEHRRKKNQQGEDWHRWTGAVAAVLRLPAGNRS